MNLPSDDEQRCRVQVLQELLARLPCQHEWTLVSIGNRAPCGSRAMAVADICVSCGTILLTGLYSESGAGEENPVGDA